LFFYLFFRHVINYDFPKNVEEYVHRVGRTGRAGRTGLSISYITREDWAIATDLIKILEEANQEVPYALREMSERFTAMKERRKNEDHRFGGRRGSYAGGRSGGYPSKSSRQDAEYDSITGGGAVSGAGYRNNYY